MPIRIIVYLAIALALSSCQKAYEQSADIDEAVLHSPKGKIDLQFKKGIALVNGSVEGYPISMSIFPTDKTTILRMGSIKNATIKIESSKAYYQLNNGKKTNLQTKRSLYNINNYNIIAPSTMDYYSRDGDGLHVSRKRKKITKSDIKKMKQETYHYYIPILINNERYAIDVTFRLKVKSSWRAGVPGMP